MLGESSSGSVPRLLVIDDDHAVRRVLANVARGAGFAVTDCDGGCELDACLGEHADMIILDLVMPGSDGIEIIERLAVTHSSARLVLVSGQDRRVLASASRLASAHGLKVAAVFTKPFSNAELRTCLHQQRSVMTTGETARLRCVPLDIRASRIDQALDSGELVLHYQPQVSVDTLEWVGVEALVRWEHPELGMLAPDTFVPVAESEPSLMHRFTDYILRHALADLMPTTKVGGFEGRISLNVTADVLATVQFPQRLVTIAVEAGVSVERLVLEVTETTLPTDPVRALAIQTRLRMLGVSLAVDDFGTGHSSLERLHTFPMDEIKIDLSFVRESTSDPEARAIVHNSILLARDLRVRCVAEGVESIEALRLLRTLRCGYAQGYYMGRALPAAELAQWGKAWQPRRAQILAAVGKAA